MPGTRPTQAKRRERQAVAALGHRDGYVRRTGLGVRDEFARAVERMTNRQRSRWARVGYPGLQRREVEPLWAFVEPERVA